METSGPGCAEPFAADVVEASRASTSAKAAAKAVSMGSAVWEGGLEGAVVVMAGPGTGGVAVGMVVTGNLKRTWGVILSGLAGTGMGIGGCSVAASLLKS